MRVELKEKSQKGQKSVTSSKENEKKVQVEEARAGQTIWDKIEVLLGTP
jgi:hypothetical protein